MGLLCNEKAENLLDSTTMELPKYPSSSSSSTRKAHQQNLQKDSEHLDCPRCGSKNTKFCYYNNYNKSQPRHFCKACKRHWTKGGTLRNVPVGGCRKNKRLKTTSSSDKSPSITTAVSVAPSSSTSVNLMYHQDCHDLYLGDQQGLKEITEDNQKNISSLVFDAIMDNSSRSFSFSGIDSLTLDGGSGSSIQSSLSGIQDKNNVYYYYDHCSNNSQLESLESSSTITTVTQSNNFFYPTWNSDGTAAAAEMVDCWNLNDLDALISTDINVPWDDDDDNHKSLII